MTYKCDNPAHAPFSTEDLDAYRNHVASSIHTTRGEAPCSICGAINQPVLFTGKLQPRTAPSLCPTCAKNTIDGIEATKKADDAKKAEIVDSI